MVPPPPPPHVLIVTFPAQGHINPSLRFAKRLLSLGVHVTLATSVYAHRLILKANGAGVPRAAGFNFAPFSDGYDQGFRKDRGDDFVSYMSGLKARGSLAVRDIISACAADGRPVTAVVRTILLPWVADVARDVELTSSLLWIQPAAVLGLYYYFFHGHEDVFEKEAVELPGLPRLESRDLPSFLQPSGSEGDYSFALAGFREEMEMLDRELETGQRPTVLVNTFDALEAGTLNTADIRYNLVSIGPLVPPAFLDEDDPTDTAFRGDLFENGGDDDINRWLRTQPESSVVYISFGSILNPSKPQKEEIARALLETKRPFLWVIRKKLENEAAGEEDGELSRREELEKQGMIVGWCAQTEVLKHPSVGCFVTHCGWNSTLESICSGVPVVAFPHWTDQGTNAKLLQDVWRTGVRVAAPVKNEDGVDVVGSGEIKRCIEIVTGDGEELRRNARRWRDLAWEAAGEGGSSDKNLRLFAEKVAGRIE
ncbi:unnamed protein product [Cuscuta campestris]|uniref:Glycosyltransferase n=1 Tax=Cuscuta campestris TaxID=132261 RepID=A0A484LGM8_9ASTE|nr:unnamed protein product [Cuscuta campestris]